MFFYVIKLKVLGFYTFSTGFRTEHENLHIYLKLSCRLTWFKWKS